MIARCTVLAAVLGVAAASLGGCAKGPPPPKKIGLVTDTLGFGDRSYNDEAYAGLLACKAETRADISAMVPATPDEYGPKLTLFATENFDAVIGLGYAMAPDVGVAARRFENTHFAIIDAVVNLPNVDSITFKEEEGSFLAGALGALVSKTGTIAFIGGADSPLLEKYEAGYVAGARQADPRVRVEVRYTGSFDDEAAARRTAAALYSGGADIAYVVAGKAGLGAIAEASSRPHAYVIGADSNEDRLAPGKVLTSVVKRVDMAAFRICREANAQKFTSGHVALGVADDGITLTSFEYTRAVIGAAAIARVEALREAIAAGKIVVPASRAALARFHPAPPGPRGASRDAMNDSSRSLTSSG
jgi:basic membrane protein A